MFSVFNFSTLTTGIICDIFSGSVYGAFGLVSYRIVILRWLFMFLLSLCLNAVIAGEVFVSSDNLFQARVTEDRKE